jgi:predicted nucleic acid-binding protein
VKDLVADASVLIPWIHEGEEPHSEPSLRLRRDFLARKVRIAVPRLLYLEVANWYVRASKRAWIDPLGLDRFYRMDFGIFDPGPEDHLGIVQSAQRHDLTAYDAAYLYMAVQMDRPLWTADEGLIRAWGDRPGGHIRYYRSPR